MSSVVASNVKTVQIDCLVIMKIAKLVDSELAASATETTGEACQGILTGLVSVNDQRLEVTNCFPFARAVNTVMEDDEDAMINQDEGNRQDEIVDILAKFRMMNVDYELVGFFYANAFGTCFAHDMLDSLVNYQSIVNDGIFIIYDPLRAHQGRLSLKAYRLSSKALELGLNGDWSPEKTKADDVTFENVFEELPVNIKNSHLVNVMIAEMALSNKYASLSSSTHLKVHSTKPLEMCLRSLIASVDNLSKCIVAYNEYIGDKHRYDQAVDNLMKKLESDNKARVSRGESPLSMEEIKKMKPPQMKTVCGMLDCFLSSSTTSALADYADESSKANISKLSLIDALAGKENESDDSDC